MVTLFLRQGENGKQVLLSFPATAPAEKADVAATMESLKSMSKTVTIAIIVATILYDRFLFIFNYTYPF